MQARPAGRRRGRGCCRRCRRRSPPPALRPARTRRDAAGRARPAAAIAWRSTISCRPCPAAGPLCLASPSSVSIGQVEPVEARVLALEPRHHLEALRVVVEAAERPPWPAASARSPACPKGGWPEVVRQRQRLGQVLVETQHAGDGAGDLRHLQAVGEARAIVVALVEHEHLRLVGEAPEGGGMHDAVAVALEGGAHGAGGLGVDAARRSPPPGLRRQPAVALDDVRRQSRGLRRGLGRRLVALQCRLPCGNTGFDKGMPRPYV